MARTPAAFDAVLRTHLAFAHIRPTISAESFIVPTVAVIVEPIACLSHWTNLAYTLTPDALSTLALTALTATNIGSTRLTLTHYAGTPVVDDTIAIIIDAIADLLRDLTTGATTIANPLVD